MLNATSAERIDVAAAVERIAGDLLGAHVLRRADDEPRPRHLLRLDVRRLRDAEVHDLHAGPTPSRLFAIMMLSGLRSRWTIPMSCATASASAGLPHDLAPRARAAARRRARGRRSAARPRRTPSRGRSARPASRRSRRCRATFGWLMRLAFAASRLKRLIASASFTMPGFITFTALLRPIFTCSARYTLAHAAFAELLEHVVAVGDDRADEVRAAALRAQRRAVARTEPLVGRILGAAGGADLHGALTLHALDAQDLVADEDALARLARTIAAHGERDAIPAARVVHEELRVLAADLGVPATHRLIVRKNPVAGFAAEHAPCARARDGRCRARCRRRAAAPARRRRPTAPSIPCAASRRLPVDAVPDSRAGGSGAAATRRA